MRTKKTEQMRVVGREDVRPLAVDTATAAEMLSLAPGTLENIRSERGVYRGPRYARIGSRVVYPVAELERYLAEHTFGR